MAAKIHVGNVGVVFEVPFVDETGAIINLSGASVKQILAQLPDKTVIAWNATFTTDGTDGKIRYTTQSSGDLPQSGDWRFQGFAVVSSDRWTTDETPITVYANLDTP